MWLSFGIKKKKSFIQTVYILEVWCNTNREEELVMIYEQILFPTTKRHPLPTQCLTHLVSLHSKLSCLLNGQILEFKIVFSYIIY